MGTTTLQILRGDEYNDLINTTINEYDPKVGVDQLFGTEMGGNYIAVDPVTKLMYESSRQSTGGLELQQTNLENLPDGGPIDPYSGFTIADKQLTDTMTWAMGYYAVPMVVYGADKEMNQGPAKVVDYVQLKMAASHLAGARIMARSVHGNGNQYYDSEIDPATGLAKGVKSWSFSTDFAPLVGFGWDNSTTANVLLSNRNTYAGQSRAAKPIYQSKTYDAQSGLSGVGGTNIANLAGWTLDNLSLLIDLARVGSMFADTVVMPPTYWRKTRHLLIAKQALEYNTDMVKLGIKGLIYDGATIVPSYDFCYPTQLFAFNRINTRIDFARMPYFTEAVHDIDGGYEVYKSVLHFVVRMISKFPGQTSAYYNLPTA